MFILCVSFTVPSECRENGANVAVNMEQTRFQSEYYLRWTITKSGPADEGAQRCVCTTVTAGLRKTPGLLVSLLRWSWAVNFAETTQLLFSTSPSCSISLSIKVDLVLKHFHRHSPPVCVQTTLALRWTPSVPLH